jgi:PiT family inorganic phosphate transporter
MPPMPFLQLSAPVPLPPHKAVILAAVFNMVGVLVTGTAVATTIGTGIVQPEVIGLTTVAAAMLTVITWTTAAWRFGIPTSETHELIAALAGAGLATAGPSSLLWEGWRKVLIGLGLSTILGFLLGFSIMTLIYWFFRRINRSSSNRMFSRLQILSAAFTAFSHGSNDGQKFMGIFALALFLGGIMPDFQIPHWIILLCGTTMAIGTAFGGWRIIRTVGTRITRLEPHNGFAADIGASIAIMIASFMGVPLSTTHTISSSIMGVGATRGLSAVNWSITTQIVSTWVLTFPACMILGYIFTWAFKLIF